MNTETEMLPYERVPFSISMKDGALLHGEAWKRLNKRRRGGRNPVIPLQMPLLCLPSELGNKREYEKFLSQIMAQASGPVVAYTVDLRGRGLSSGAKVLDTGLGDDADDIVTLLDVLGLHHCAVLASGIGALPLFLAGVKRPGSIAKLVLNDGGPALDNVGIARQTALRQRLSAPQSWDDVSNTIKTLKSDDFPTATKADYDAMARIAWKMDDSAKAKNQRPVINHHPDLVRLSNSVRYDERPPELWKEFALFRRCPTLLVNGAHSTMMTKDIVEKMKAHHGAMDVITAPDQGHIPDLGKGDLAEQVLGFLRKD